MSIIREIRIIYNIFIPAFTNHFQHNQPWRHFWMIMKVGDVGKLLSRLSPGLGRITLLGNHISIIMRGGSPWDTALLTHTHYGGLVHPAVRWAHGYRFSRSENIAWLYQWLLVQGFPPPQPIKPHSSEITQRALMYNQSKCCRVATESSSTHCCQKGWSFLYHTSSNSRTWDCIASAFVFLEEFWNKWSTWKMSFSVFEKNL